MPEDEKGSGGLWDKAGEIAEQYAVMKNDKEGSQPAFADEDLQELIYNALKEVQEDERNGYEQWRAENERELLSDYEDYVSDAMAAQYDSTTVFGLRNVVGFDDYCRNRYKRHKYMLGE